MAELPQPLAEEIVGEGRIIGEGTPEALQRSSSGYVRQFMEGEPDGPVPYQHPATEYLKDLLLMEKSV